MRSKLLLKKKISESHDRESKRLEDHFVLENFQVISNVYQRQGKGGRPAIIVNNEKYEIQDITNTLVQIPWGVEVTWAILTPKNVTNESKIKNIALGPIYSKPNSTSWAALESNSLLSWMADYPWGGG